MKIAVAQMNVYANQPDKNYQTIKEWVDQAKKAHADLIVFPEMCVGGYFLQDRYLDHYFCETLVSYNDMIKDLSSGIGIIFGNIVYQPLDGITKGHDGRNIRGNGAYFCYQGKWLENANGLPFYLKHLLPDYRAFNDSRYFYSGIDQALSKGMPLTDSIRPFVFELKGKEYKIGIEICEDMWSDDYPLNITKAYVNQECDLIINISCSPWTIGKEVSRDKMIKKHATRNDKFVPFLYVNNVGMQNNGKTVMVFDGDSALYDQFGNRQVTLNDSFESELKIFELDEHDITKRDEHKLLDALTCGIKEFDRQLFDQKIKWIIGLSGGLDSSINAALLVHALGKQRVVGYNMASRFNSVTTIDNAGKLAESLGIAYREGNIEKVVSATTTTLADYGYQDTDQGLIFENIQARTRGQLLASFAAVENGVVVNNGNKVEVALGYCTLYGDSIGALAPIGDLTKVQLFTLAKDINDAFDQEIILTNLLPKMADGSLEWEIKPSAELRNQQYDPMKWYYHDHIIAKLFEYPTARIEDLLESYLDGSIYDSEIGKWIKYYGLDKPEAFIDDLEWVIKSISRAVYKRIQMPPIIMVSKGSFGNDYQEAQLNYQATNRFLALKEAILAKAKK